MGSRENFMYTSGKHLIVLFSMAKTSSLQLAQALEKRSAFCCPLLLRSFVSPSAGRQQYPDLNSGTGGIIGQYRDHDVD
jgi:hypothetical protein